MKQTDLKKLVKLLNEWSKFIESGRHERPEERYTIDEAKEVSEPLAAEFANTLSRQVHRWIV